MTDADFDAMRREMLPKMPAMLAEAIASGEPTWTPQQLKDEFEVERFEAPLVVAKRRADGSVGTLYFTHEPRMYFGWQPDKETANQAHDWACSRCRRPLYKQTAMDGSNLTWVHGGMLFEPPDHEPVPVPRESVANVIEECEFCTNQDVAAHVIAEPFQLELEGWVQEFNGTWEACPRCATLIRENRWDDLLDRVVKALSRKHGFEPSLIRPVIARMYNKLNQKLIGIDWKPGRKPKASALPASPVPKARPSVRFAKDVPEAQSKLIRFLEQSAPDMWAAKFREVGYRSLTAFRNDGIPVYDGSLGFAIPGEFDKDDREETARALARWQAWAVRESALHFVNDTMTGRVREAAADLPEFAVDPELVPHEMGLLCWAKPVAGEAVQITAMSWCPIEGGLWLTFYNDTGLSPYDEDQRAMKGWLEEAGTMAVPWGGSSHAGQKIAEFFTEAFRTLLTTWLFMADEIVAEVREERLPPKDARKIRRRGHPAPAVSYISLRKVVRPKPEEEKFEDAGRKYHGHWKVSGHWRHYKAERYRPEVRSRPQWIEAYEKGDAEEPAEKTPRAKVYTLNK